MKHLRAGDLRARVVAQSKLVGLGPEAAVQEAVLQMVMGEMGSHLPQSFLSWLCRRPWNAAPGTWLGVRAGMHCRPLP